MNEYEQQNNEWTLLMNNEYNTQKQMNEQHHHIEHNIMNYSSKTVLNEQHSIKQQQNKQNTEWTEWIEQMNASETEYHHEHHHRQNNEQQNNEWIEQRIRTTEEQWNEMNECRMNINNNNSNEQQWTTI